MRSFQQNIIRKICFNRCTCEAMRSIKYSARNTIVDTDPAQYLTKTL